MGLKPHGKFNRVVAACFVMELSAESGFTRNEFLGCEGCLPPMQRRRSCIHCVTPSCCPCFQPKKWKPYCNIWGTYRWWERMFGREEDFHAPVGSCLFFHLPLCITLQLLDVVWAEWGVNVRQDTGLEASECRGGNKAKQGFRWQPACHRGGGGNKRTCHLEGLGASGLLQKHQQLSVLSKLHFLFKMKMSWRQKRMPVMPFDPLVFPRSSSFVSKTLFWHASLSKDSCFCMC